MTLRITHLEKEQRQGVGARGSQRLRGELLTGWAAASGERPGRALFGAAGGGGVGWPAAFQCALRRRLLRCVAAYGACGAF